MADATLLPGDLKIVGQQVWLDGGALDLLALDAPDRWVVVEIKRGRLSRSALAQALDYVSSIVGLAADELESKLRPGLSKFGDGEALARAVREQLDAESEDTRRHVDVMLVGVGADPTLERIADYLRGFEIQISVVSFEVFERDGGPRLLVREVEEQSAPRAPQPKRTVAAVRERAVKAGVVAQFDRFVRMAEEAGLHVQPVTRSVRVTAPAHRSRTLMFATPRDDSMGIGARAQAFEEFYPHLTAADVSRELGFPDEGVRLTGEELDAQLNRVESFLKEKLPSPDGDGE